ncbi:MAG: 4Fe-4S binding protein [Candidatus Aenigmatarchaeota archaeon]|nr:MAG: 4Fe-4S binding protein [Candidatus Aenigmarchaeota archaeon]
MDQGIRQEQGWTIDDDKCLRCGACVGVCPPLALDLTERGGIHFIEEKCTHCTLCEKVCPIGCIKVEPPKAKQHAH